MTWATSTCDGVIVILLCGSPECRAQLVDEGFFFPLGESFYSPVFGVLMKINGESLELMITLYLPFLTDEEIREI